MSPSLHAWYNRGRRFHTGLINAVQQMCVCSHGPDIHIKVRRLPGNRGQWTRERLAVSLRFLVLAALPSCPTPRRSHTYIIAPLPSSRFSSRWNSVGVGKKQLWYGTQLATRWKRRSREVACVGSHFHADIRVLSYSFLLLSFWWSCRKRNGKRQQMSCRVCGSACWVLSGCGGFISSACVVPLLYPGYPHTRIIKLVSRWPILDASSRTLQPSCVILIMNAACCKGHQVMKTGRDDAWGIKVPSATQSLGCGWLLALLDTKNDPGVDKWYSSVVFTVCTEAQTLSQSNSSRLTTMQTLFKGHTLYLLLLHVCVMKASPSVQEWNPSPHRSPRSNLTNGHSWITKVNNAPRRKRSTFSHRVRIKDSVSAPSLLCL